MIKPGSKILLLEKEIQKLKKLVYLDALTNVYNRRGFLELGRNYFEQSEKKGSAERRKAGSYFERSEKKGSAERSEAGSYFQFFREDTGKRRKNGITSLALIFLDIDDFKKINDKYGHRRGDRVLKQLAKFLKLTLRKTDLLGRWGGEEFVILLVNASKANAQKIAQKLCQLTARTKIAGLHLTISLGLIIPKKEKTLAIIINKADKLMYQAKKQGKDKVITL